GYNVAAGILGVCRHIASEIPAVGSLIRHLLIQGSTLNHLAPFHVVEEEGLGLVRVVKLPKGDRTACVEPVNVVTQVRYGAREGISGVQPVVAEELPCGSMEGLGTGLHNRGDRAAGRKAVVRAIVRCQ